MAVLRSHQPESLNKSLTSLHPLGLTQPNGQQDVMFLSRSAGVSILVAQGLSYCSELASGLLTQTKHSFVNSDIIPADSKHNIYVLRDSEVSRNTKQLKNLD